LVRVPLSLMLWEIVGLSNWKNDKRRNVLGWPLSKMTIPQFSYIMAQFLWPPIFFSKCHFPLKEVINILTNEAFSINDYIIFSFTNTSFGWEFIMSCFFSNVHSYKTYDPTKNDKPNCMWKWFLKISKQGRTWRGWVGITKTYKFHGDQSFEGKLETYLYTSRQNVSTFWYTRKTIANTRISRTTNVACCTTVPN